MRARSVYGTHQSVAEFSSLLDTIQCWRAGSSFEASGQTCSRDEYDVHSDFHWTPIALGLARWLFMVIQASSSIGRPGLLRRDGVSREGLGQFEALWQKWWQAPTYSPVVGTCACT